MQIWNMTWCSWFTQQRRRQCPTFPHWIEKDAQQYHDHDINPQSWIYIISRLVMRKFKWTCMKKQNTFYGPVRLAARQRFLNEAFVTFLDRYMLPFNWFNLLGYTALSAFILCFCPALQAMFWEVLLLSVLWFTWVWRLRSLFLLGWASRNEYKPMSGVTYPLYAVTTNIQS